MVTEIRIEQTSINNLVEVNGTLHKIIVIMKTGKDKELVTLILEDGTVLTLPKTELIKVY